MEFVEGECGGGDGGGGGGGGGWSFIKGVLVVHSGGAPSRTRG